MLTRLQLGFSHLCEHKLRYVFRDILNLLCPCNIEAETTIHCFLHCHFYNAKGVALLNNLNEIGKSFLKLNKNTFIDLILLGADKFNDKENYNISISTIKLIKDSQRFEKNYYNYLSINVKW